jgi:hypothetical protein
MEYLLVAIFAVGSLGDYDVKVIKEFKTLTSCQSYLKKHPVYPDAVNIICAKKDWN